MFGLSSSGKESIGAAIDKMFDALAVKLLGHIPKLRGKNLFFFGERPGLNLAHIFIQAMNDRSPNHLERDALKSMLESAHGYVESLKSKTRSNVTESIDALVKEAKFRGDTLTTEQIGGVFTEEMEKARSHFITIAESETTKTRNVAHTLDITRVAEDLGDPDPLVYFVIVRDGQTCNECLRLHMMPDGTTPRVWKLSEVSAGYHKRGEDRPSMCGEHPHCRCSIAYLGRDYGFKNGYIGYIGKGYNAYEDQKS